MPGWNPWRALRSRPHVRLAYKQMHPSRGLIVDHGDGTRTITLHSTLSQLERNEVLAHELVHDELDLIWPVDCPAPIRQKGEHLVEMISDERLLPVADLENYLDRRAGETVTVWEAAGDLGVSEQLARRQMRRVSGF